MSRKKNIYFLIFTPILFGISIFVFYKGILIQDSLFEASMFFLLASTIWFVGVIWNLILMYNTGTLNRTVWKKPIFLSISILFVGCIFRSQNWPGGEIIISASCLIILVSYGKHFLKKNNKIFLDYSKFLFAISAFIVGLLLLFQLDNIVTSIAWMCCIILHVNLLIVFYFHLYKQKSALS